jgi:hypothetical protein
MPASVRDAVLQWWPITGAGSRVKPWEWIRPNTAAPEAEIYGDGHDSFPPNFSDWNEILGRICASEDVAKAAAQFEAAHSPDMNLWRDLVVETLQLPTRFMHQDKRTNKDKAQILTSLCAHLDRIAEIIEKEQRIAQPEFEPNASAMPLPGKEKDVMSEPKAKGKKDVRGKPKAKDEKHKLRAKHIDSPQVPNELRYDHELRKLNSKYRLYDVGLLSDIWTDPVELGLLRAASWRELDEEAESVRLSACVSALDFDKIAKALAARLRAELEELAKPDLIQMSKGQAWRRYAVMHLEGIFSRFFEPWRLAELSPGPNQMLAALINAAVPEAKAAPVDLKQVSDIRTRLAAKSAVI